VLWRGFAAPDSGVRSIPLHLEQRAEVLRARFLAWVHDLGERSIDGRRLRDHLEIRPGFSFWWMTLLTEKSNAFHSLQLISVLKVMALQDLLGTTWRGKIVLASADRMLAETLQQWCRNSGSEFEWREQPSTVARPSLAKRIYHRLPHSAQAFLTLLAHIGQRRHLRGAGSAQLASSTARVTFCSYLFNLDRKGAESGRFVTSFWTELHAALERSGLPSNWVLVFIPHDFVPTARRARELVTRFNEQAPTGSVHAALDAALSWQVIRSALRDYRKISRAARRLKRGLSLRLGESSLDLAPLFERDWNSSLHGSAAMSNCLHLNLIEQTLRALPPQRVGCYLQENIGWEMAFVHCWKSAGHGRLVGVPHSTVRFWDLRYFFDPRSYVRSGGTDLPMPDLVALNGPAAVEAYRHSGYPESAVVEVEALRYLHLANMTTARKPADAQSGPLRVLVLGDYMQPTTRHQMKWLVDATRLLPPDTRFVVKPHPACPINPADYPSISMQLTTLTLDKLLGDCDVAYTSNMTSAAVDAYSAGVPVVSVLDGDAFNISPLRGMSGVTYVMSAEELGKALGAARSAAGSAPSGRFFHIDRQLPRWRALLELREPT
jgi:surface carbohydrate biosynthesis protein (TIGR04326 family)